ncbi:MAG TPA: response regulator, partial [Thermoanaerobaculia bacterium]|nr:response regulator [Thermoanaerobaculia bacterium]
MNEPLRALVVDDELLARSLLGELLDEIEGVDVVGEAANGFEAVQMIEQLGPDLVFLDIQMPKLSGFEVLELLGDAAPEVVFVTAYDEHALRAFEVHAVDYLLKPVDPERLRTAIERAGERRGTRTGPRASELAAAARPPAQPLDRVLIREQGRVHVLPVARIDYVEAQDDYLVFVVGDHRLRRQQTLAELEGQLDPA